MHLHFKWMLMSASHEMTLSLFATMKKEHITFGFLFWDHERNIFSEFSWMMIRWCCWSLWFYFSFAGRFSCSNLQASDRYWVFGYGDYHSWLWELHQIGNQVRVAQLRVKHVNKMIIYLFFSTKRKKKHLKTKKTYNKKTFSVFFFLTLLLFFFPFLGSPYAPKKSSTSYVPDCQK